MSDLISRQAAIDALTTYIYNVYKAMTGERMLTDKCRQAAESVLGELPTVQPNHNAEVSKMEIIRCKDCKHGVWYDAAGGHYCYCLESNTMGRTETDFCSRAERRGEAE